MADSTAEKKTYDYIVVGGGTSGLVVASRLSEDPEVSVLVVEAGGDKKDDPLVLTPGLVGAMYGKDEYDWNFSSVPQPTLNNRTINQARGRMLGGSSSLNFLIMIYPSRASLDAWAALGNDGWDFDALEPYFRKFATAHAPSASAGDMCRMDDDGAHDARISEREKSGPLAVSFGEGFGPANAAWFDAFASLGLGATSDMRSGAAVGAVQNAATIDPATKTRACAVTAYLTDQVRSRPNLTVLTDTQVKRVMLEPADGGSGGEFVAKGVEAQSKDGTEHTLLASGEVILAAGALHTPQVLELSGIGDRQLLEKHGIPVKVDNPNVGEHMQDHPVICPSFEVADGVVSADIMRSPDVVQAVVAQYQSSRDGPLGQSIISSAYVPLADDSGVLSTEARRALLDAHLEPQTSDPKARCPERERKIIRDMLETADEPAFQLMLFPSQLHIPQNPPSMSAYLTPVEPDNYLTVMAMLNHPFSRGCCHITSPDFRALPVWDPRYNADAADLELLARAARFTERLVATAPLSGGIFKPGGRRLQSPAAAAAADDDDDQARALVRARQISTFHVCSSAAMLPREHGGVVDARLRVYGVRNLRCVDASVFPLEPLGNIQSTVYAVAERAADILKRDRKEAGKCSD